MSAHRTLNDLFRAFDSVGPGRLEDPGDTKTITFTQWGQICSVVTTAAQTRTLAQPTKPGILATIALDEDGGDLTLTVTGGYNDEAATSVTFDAAGDFVTFISIKVGTSYYWRVVTQEGTNAGLDFTTNMAGGAGFTGVNTILEHSITKVNGLIKTEILIDLTGVNGGGTAADIIGGDGLTHCHIGQITAAVNGTIFAGSMRCIELPATSNVDINLNSATIATGAEDADVTALTGYAELLNAGNWANGTVLGLTAVPAANTYLYLSNGAATAGTYSAGIFLIELWGR